MVDFDVLNEKINNIQNCLKRIHDTVKGDLSTLHNLDTQDIVVLNLQRAIQLTLDVAFHVASSEKLGIPQKLKESFRLLHHHHIINQSLSEKMERMVGFRNIAVHDYQAIDEEILHYIVKDHLKDIEDFYSAILRHYRKKTTSQQ